MTTTDREMIRIPAGKFLMGTDAKKAQKMAASASYHVSWLSGEVPCKKLDLPSFDIDRYPVTNEQYEAFCKATGYAKGESSSQLPLHPNHPVTGLNQEDAAAYARWVGKRLPTEAEWEKAARGEDGRLYPWGNTFDPDACQWNREHTAEGPGTSPVDAHPSGASPYGIMDMCGNVAEWCSDGPGPNEAFIKGGCWFTGEIINLRSASRNMSGSKHNRSEFYGIRCAKSIPVKEES